MHYQIKISVYDDCFVAKLFKLHSRMTAKNIVGESIASLTSSAFDIKIEVHKTRFPSLALRERHCVSRAKTVQWTVFSESQFTVHVRSEEESESLDQIRQYPTTPDGYAEFLARINRYKATGADVKVGVESTGNTRFFKNRVEKAGAEVTVINTLKFKVINESTKKTDKHDASTISEFLSKDMLPESYLCGKETENIRRLLKSRERLVRSTVGQKNEIHALLVSLGLSDELRSLQSKKGRQRILDTLESNNGSLRSTAARRLTKNSPREFLPCCAVPFATCSKHNQ